jgi:hypothetical protein
LCVISRLLVDIFNKAKSSTFRGQPQNVLAQQLLAHRIDQGLQLHTAFADPLGQRGARKGMSRALEDRLLPVQRQVIQVLGHEHLREQSRRGQALVDHVRRHGCLNKPLATAACPFAPDVPLHREHTGLVVQLLGHVLADALHRLATGADGVLRLVPDFSARQVCGQRLAPGRLLLARSLASGLQLIDLGGYSCQVGVQRLIQQALLLGVELLALRGELQPLQDRVLVRELLDDGLLERRLCARCTQQFAQLLGVEGFEVIGDHEE